MHIDTHNKIYRYVGPPYCQAEMYAVRVACYTLVSHVEYVLRALLRLQNKDGSQRRTDRQTDGRTPDRYISWLTERRG